MRSFTFQINRSKKLNTSMDKLPLLIDALKISGLIFLKLTAITIAIILVLRLMAVLAGDLKFGDLL